jgi:hypothetical protein
VGTLANSPKLTSYSTTFPAIANPISESGNWVNSSSFWTKCANFDLGSGVESVSGTQPLSVRDEDDHYNDSYAILNPALFNFGADQWVEVDIYRKPTLESSVSHEIEILLRAQEVALAGAVAAPRGYEINLSGLGGYQEIVYWDGLSTHDFFHYRSNGGSSGGNGESNSTGDVLRAEIEGSPATIRTYLNGNLIQTVSGLTDTAPGTSLGIGFYRGLNGAGTLGDYGITGFRAGTL